MAAPPSPPPRGGAAPPAPHEGPRCCRVWAAPFGEAMALPGRFRSAFSFFVHDQLPELQRRGLPVAHMADAVRYCSQAWEVSEGGMAAGPSLRAGLAGGSAPFHLAALCGLRWPGRPALSSGSCALGGVVASLDRGSNSRSSLVCGLPSLIFALLCVCIQSLWLC